MGQRKGPSLTIPVDADTNNLSAKLKAIAKHANALAEELDVIDKPSTNNLDGLKAHTAVFDECFELSTDEKKEKLDALIMRTNLE